MIKFLKRLWEKWIELGLIIGNFMSGVFLTIFYFTVFALFAIPFKLLSKPLNVQSPNSNWIIKNKKMHTLEDFKYEG